MTTVTVTDDYRVAIPESVRKALGITPGQQLQAIVYAGHIALVPVRPIREMRGFLKGMAIDFEREPDRD
jgi:AbrB family looped-hinge helix DNA binding protein